MGGTVKTNKLLLNRPKLFVNTIESSDKVGGVEAINDASLSRHEEKGLEETAGTNRVSIYQKTVRGETSRVNLEQANATPQKAQNINVDI